MAFPGVHPSAGAYHPSTHETGNPRTLVPPKTPEHIIKEARERYQRGEKPAQIAAALHLGTSTVRGHTSDLPRQPRPRITPDTVAAMLELRGKGLSREAVAKKLNVSPVSVWRHEKKQKSAATRRRTAAPASRRS